MCFDEYVLTVDELLRGAELIAIWPKPLVNITVQTPEPSAEQAAREKEYREREIVAREDVRLGEPGICFDNELCLRACGSEAIRSAIVSFRFVPFKGAARQYSMDGGILFSKEIRMGNQWRNHRRISTMYSPRAFESSSRKPTPAYSQ